MEAEWFDRYASGTYCSECDYDFKLVFVTASNSKQDLYPPTALFTVGVNVFHLVFPVHASNEGFQIFLQFQ